MKPLCFPYILSYQSHNRPIFSFSPHIIYPKTSFTLSASFLLSHILKQLSSHSKSIPHQIIMCRDHRNTWMRSQIKRLCLHIHILNISQDTVNMLLQWIECVLEVLIVILLLGALVVGFDGNVELFGGSGVIVLQDFVQEEIPDLLLY